MITNTFRSMYCISQATASLLCAEANMLYLETPAGVGFSYSNDTSYYLGANDAKTGQISVARCKLHVKLSAIL